MNTKEEPEESLERVDCRILFHDAMGSVEREAWLSGLCPQRTAEQVSSARDADEVLAATLLVACKKIRRHSPDSLPRLKKVAKEIQNRHKLSDPKEVVRMWEWANADLRTLVESLGITDSVRILQTKQGEHVRFNDLVETAYGIHILYALDAKFFINIK